VRIADVRVAVLDVGSNSVRLLVADVETGRVTPVRSEREYLRLGVDAYTLGRIGRQKLDEARSVGRAFARIAREAGAARLETFVTAPGRQISNPDELVDALVAATGAPVVSLDAREEGCLAWEGAIAGLDEPPEVVGVVDLGGGSCELAIGTPLLGPAWVESFEAGGLRVTEEFLGGDPPAAEAIAAARMKIADLLTTDARPPRPDLTLVVGGVSRAVARIVGRQIGPDRLDELIRMLSDSPAETVVRRHGISAERALTLLGGTLVLAEVARLVDQDLVPARGGVREGAALALARTHAAAA
jgi:exopolyphosphatase / guanosine-5'-triphosphate,3'-diphosphate pyrophosphatase